MFSLLLPVMHSKVCVEWPIALCALCFLFNWRKLFSFVVHNFWQLLFLGGTDCSIKRALFPVFQITNNSRVFVHSSQDLFLSLNVSDKTLELFSLNSSPLRVFSLHNLDLSCCNQLLNSWPQSQGYSISRDFKQTSFLETETGRPYFGLKCVQEMGYQPLHFIIY